MSREKYQESVYVGRQIKRLDLQGDGQVGLGDFLRMPTPGQKVIGTFNDIEGDASKDQFQIGAGTAEERFNALRVKEDGTFQIAGGPVVIEDFIGNVQQVYIEGKNQQEPVYLK